MGPAAARDPQIPLGQAMRTAVHLWKWWRRERAITKLQDHLSERTGRRISRAEALAAHERWRSRNPRKDPRLH